MGFFAFVEYAIRQIGIELGVLVSAAGHTGPKYGRRFYDISRGRTVDLQPYRRLYGAMLLQQVYIK